MKNKIKNKDIIDFRHELIDKINSDIYLLGSICNDEKTNIMTEERKKVLEDVLIMFNNHFTVRNYDVG